jgi:hypothetical protein
LGLNKGIKMQELTWIDWLWITYFVSALIFLTESISSLFMNLNNEKLDKQQKRKRSYTATTTYGDLLLNFTTPFVPVLNTIFTVWIIYDQSVRLFSVLQKPVITPYEGD